MAFLSWLLGVGCLWAFVFWITAAWKSPGLCLARAFLRSFSVSVALAPTAVKAGFVAFLAPASLVIISYPFDSHRGDAGLIANTVYAMHCFLIFWAIGFCVSLLFTLGKRYVSTRRQNAAQKAGYLKDILK
jgi:hypothetical protein